MKKVILFLAQGFEEYEAAAFTDVFGWTGICGTEPVELITVGLRNKIKCTWNFTVEPQLLLQDVKPEEFDALAIPGGFQKKGFYDDAYDERFLELIRDFDSAGKFIASVCVGALPIGKSGVLKGRKGTTYHLTNGFRRKQLMEFGVDVLDEHMVIDDNIITSTGTATAIDVAFSLLEMLTSKENVIKVKEGMAFV
ncbi:MAG: DJ-1/PfpI family protein [Spirochaetes bacterium]|nr:DJ-1/PfpI family protein [Spirochaetota bacterium]